MRGHDRKLQNAIPRQKFDVGKSNTAGDCMDVMKAERETAEL